MALRLQHSAACAACVLLMLMQCGCDSYRGATPPAQSTPADAGAVNATPEPGADHGTTTSGSSVRLPVLTNDNDPDASAGGNALRIAQVGRPQYGSAELDDNGTPATYDDDTIVYLAAPGFVGLDQFYYTVADRLDARATALVSIDVDGATRTVLRADEASTGRDSAVAIPVVQNDILARDAVPPITLSTPARGTVSIDAGGTPLDVSDDQVIYTPQAGYVGPDSFIYALGDGQRAVVNVTIGDGPNAVGEEICGIVVKGPLAGARLDIYAADALGAPLAPALAQALTDSSGAWCARVPTARQPLLVSSSGGSFVNEADSAAGQPIALADDEGLQTLVPAGERFAALTIYSNALLQRARRDAGGNDVFDLFGQRRALFAAALGFDPLTSVPTDPSAPAPDAPEASRRYALALGGMANALNTAATRLGLAAPSYALVDALIRDLSDCTLDGLDAGTPLLVNVNGAPLAMAAGLNLDLETLRFRNNRADLYRATPAAAFDLPACRAAAAAATPVADVTPPVFTQVPAPLTLTVGASGSVSTSDTAVALWLASASATDNRSGALTVNHDAPAVLPTATTVVTFSATDAAGNVTTSQSAVTVARNVAPTLTAPVPNQFSSQDAFITIPLAPYFDDPESDPMSYALNGLPVGTALLIDPVTGVLEGTPGDVEAAASPLMLTVTASDGELATSAIFSLSVAANNVPPIVAAQAVALATPEDTPLALTAAALTIVDPDDSVFALSVLPGTDYAVAGTTITPAANFNGLLSVPVTVSDGDASSATFDLTVTITAVNDAPVIVSQDATLLADEDTALSISLGDLTVSDPDDATFTLSVLPGTNYSASNTTITPAPDFNGDLTVPVAVNDGSLDSAAFALTVTITAVNDAPTFAALPAPSPVPIDTTLGPLSVMIDDVDTAAGALLVTAQSDNPALLPDGNIALAGTGLARTITLLPAAGQSGTATVSVTVSDGLADTTASFNVQVFEPLQDTDGDGLTDSDEVNVYFTDSTDPDTDGDDVRDGIEVLAGGDPLSASTRVTYVDPGGSGSDGLSWATAYLNLQQASADILSGGAAGDPRYVLLGDTRFEASGVAWALDLGGASCDQIVLVGSLAPGQVLALRDLDDAPTTLLDVQGYNGAALVVDGCRDLRVFDVHLRGGDGDLPGRTTGGGVHVSNGANAEFIDVWMTDNSAASQGGGLAVSGGGSLVTLRNARVASNVVFSGDGGGLHVDSGAVLIVEDSTLSNNISGDAGGGFFVAAGGLLSMYDSLVRGNLAITGGGQLGGGAGAVFGGLFADSSVFADNRQTRAGPQPGGGALYLENDQPVDVVHSMLLGNFSETDGGAILAQRTYAAVTLRNNLIAGNTSAAGFGGAIHAVRINSGSPLLIESNTIAYNQAVDGVSGFQAGGGVDLWNNADDVTLRDNVIWFNDDDVPGVQVDDNVYRHGSSVASIVFNNIQSSSFAGTAANIDAAPLFEQGFRLDQVGSASLDAGSQSADASGLGAPFTTASAGTADAGTLDQGYHYAGASTGVSDDAILTDETAGCLFDTVDLVFVPLIGGSDAGPGRIVQVLLGPGHSAGGTLLSRTALRPYGNASSVLALDRGNGEYRVQVSGADDSPGNRVQLEIRVDSPTATPTIIDSSELDPLFAAAGC